ncbi:conserved hypothetical protein [Culex quinquefasciatus]|uniref:MYND-type domain-containing protein n=1 Tax=Culex quinquefasciatus TaxID=7176 RepID=B0XL23_CULQU|nr:conserved hypothetical protein [Culex quinquefasciatus]|eukprot:XP_001870345.1 conserved hypothetical protein [Culex quinquefasciatus]
MKPNLLPPPLATGAIDLLQEMLLERGAIRTDFTLYQDQRRNLLLVPEQGKCDADATPATYLVGKHEEALVWYNRSICFAEKGTDQLATGIGRAGGETSAVYYEQGDHCGVKFSNSLKPCPGCVFFMYCGEECRQKSWKLWHQFECPVATKLRNFSNFNLLSTPRLFLYGLSLFDDNLAELKRFCEANEGAELNRFELDYSNLDRRELFRILHNTVARRDPIGELNGYLEEKLISYGYFLVFQANPLMSSSLRNRAFGIPKEANLHH